MALRLLKYGLGILLLCICACELQSKASVPPLAEKGVIDLTNWDFASNGQVGLTGEYEFYWNKLINPGDFNQHQSILKTDFITVPSTWNDLEIQGKAIPGDGFATYRLTILLSKKNTGLALKMREVGTSYNLFINGQKLSSAGIAGKTAESTKPGYRPEIIPLKSNESVLDLVLQISNFSHKLGGAWETITLGTGDQLQKSKESKIAYDLFLSGSIFIMALYHLGLFTLRRKELSPLYFGLFCILITLRILITGERHILMLFPTIDYEILIKFEYLTFYLAVPTFVQYFYSLFSNRFSKIITMLSTVVGFAFGALVILSPVKIFSHTLTIFQAFTLSMFMYATVVLVVASLRKESKAIIFLAGFTVLFLSSVNDMLYAQNIIQTGYIVQFGLFIFIFSQAYLISRYFSNAFTTIAIQRKELFRAKEKLQKSNDELENRIEERTAEILETNETLRQEIKERKQVQWNLQKAIISADDANRSKSEFLANMSHELRTPLNHIIGFTELLLDKKIGELNESQFEYLSDVHSSSGHLLSLINDILDLSKVEAGKMELQLARVRLRNLLENSLVILKEKALKHSIQLRLDLNGIPDTITADERKLKQIMYNLLSNSMKFTPDGGNVTIKATTHSFNHIDSLGENKTTRPGIKISVRDTGIGIDPDDFVSIFDSFEQIDNTASRKYQGTGLGLSLTKKLVELHDGKIWVESEGEGKGANFIFCIPVK